MQQQRKRTSMLTSMSLANVNQADKFTGPKDECDLCITLANTIWDA